METTKTPKCAQAKNPRALGGPSCDGPLFVVRRYFVDGSHLYTCERHKSALERANPCGPRYRLLTHRAQA